MDSKVFYGIMTIIFNGVGVPCFMQGKKGAGVARIILGIITFGVIAIINEIMGIVMGIRILCMSDAEYEKKKKYLLKGVPSGLSQEEQDEYENIVNEEEQGDNENIENEEEQDDNDE